FWLALYASVLSSLVALVTLYGEIFNRIRVVAREDYFIPTGGAGGGFIVHGEDTLEGMGAPRALAGPGLTVGISNRGRQTVQIRAVSKAYPVKRELFKDIMQQLPITIEAGHATQVVNGKEGGYAHGGLSMRRFYVVDGAGRVYPYHERWRQRVE